VQLNESLKSFAKRQVNIVAISTDKTDVLANFTERRGIKYPLLSDRGAKIIQDFNLLNATWKVAHPASVFVDRNGIIRAVLRKKGYRDRVKIADMLRVADETLVAK
tara:strand:- start:37 stop:354 length:318 start_codon:yes stop_codon:yes gene_type:complete